MSQEENITHQEEKFSHEEDVTESALKNPIQRERIDKAVALIGGPGLKVLDVGCGTGAISDLIDANGNYVTGMDLPAVVARVPKERLEWMGVIPWDAGKKPWGPGIETLDSVTGERTHISGPTITSNMFDVVFAGEIIEHFFDIEPFFTEAYRVLKPGGRLVITTPNATRTLNRVAMVFGIVKTWYEWEHIPHHVRYWTKRDLTSALRKYGFAPSRWDWGRSQAEGSDPLGFDESWLREDVTPVERMTLRNMFARLTADPVERHSFIIVEAVKT